VTALVAIALVSIALAVISRPLLSRARSGRVGSSASVLVEIEERYRSALADIQDAQNDWEIGNLSEDDYTRFREDGRRRAAAALREISAYNQQREETRVAVEREIAARAAIVQSLPPSNGKVSVNGHVPAVQPPSVLSPSSRQTTRAYLYGGMALAVFAVAGIAGLYLRAVGVQQAQAAVGAIPSPLPSSLLVDSTGGYWVARADGLMQSTDGHAWRSLAQGTPLKVIATKDGAPWLALGQTTTLISSDRGATWAPAANAPPGRDLVGAQAGPDGVYGYWGDAGIYRTADGERWDPIAPPYPERMIGFALVPGSLGGHIMYLAQGSRVIRSPDGGRTWAAASGAVNLAITGTVRAIAGDPVKGAVYAATSDGVFRTTRDGTDWERLPFRGPATAVAARGDTLMAVDDSGHVYLSNSGGVSWAVDR
jgi:hypothetical protein